ncbi:hypothetical protein Emag_004853 [Eimeria magna]
MPAATKQPAVLRKQQVLPEGTQQQHVQEQRVVCEQPEDGLKMVEGGGASRRSAREGNPLLPEKEKARKRSMLMSIKDDIGKGVLFPDEHSKNSSRSRSDADVLWKNPVPAWVCALDGFMTFAVCFETLVDVILLAGCFFFWKWIVRFIRTGAEAQDSLTAVEEQVIRFDTPGSRAEAGGRSAAAVPSAGLDP